MVTLGYITKSARELYCIAKQRGVWDPEKIAVQEDRAHWEALSAEQREQLVKICALFYEGEVSVADTLAWWVAAMPEPDRRMFLASQLFEEVKHAEFFGLYFEKVFGQVDTASYLVAQYRSVLVSDLRERGQAIGRALLSGGSAGNGNGVERALVLGMAHYMGVIEGVLAVTGYDYFDEMLGARGLFPRLLEGIRLVRADEGRHLTHGMDYLREKLREHPEYAEPVRQVFSEENQKIPAQIAFVFQPNPFGLDHARMQAIAFQHLEQRCREVGLT